MSGKTLKFPAKSLLRKHWGLDPKVVFLNHGSFGACPKVVLRFQEKLRREMESEPLLFLGRQHDDRVDQARKSLARFLGTRHSELAFVTNATSAVNAVVRSWKIRRGDEILTTSLDYNACRNVLIETAARARAKVKVIDLPFPIHNEQEIEARILSAVGRRTRFAMLDHVTSNSALVLPVEKLATGLEKQGVRVLIDGAHAPGMLALNPSKLGASWYTGNLHKWVCAPKGAAFLWARQDTWDDLQPAVISHGNNTRRVGFEAWQDRFDWPGTFDPTAWFSVPCALDVVSELHPGGWSAIRKANRRMALDARDRICGLLEIEPPCPARMLGSMATIPLPGRFQNRHHAGRMAPEQLRLFEEFGIEVPFVKVGDLRCFRISAHLHNAPAEYDYLAQAILRI